MDPSDEFIKKFIKELVKEFNTPIFILISLFVILSIEFLTSINMDFSIGGTLLCLALSLVIQLITAYKK